MTKVNKIIIPAVFLTTLFFNFTQILVFVRVALPLADRKITQASPDLSAGECSLSHPIKTNFPEMNHSFSMAEYPIKHHGNNYLNINVIFTDWESDVSKESKTMNKIHLQINDFLTNYPNESDFWEVLNQNLVKAVFAANPTMSSLTIQLEVLPSQKLPNIRTTTVTLTDKQQLFGKWNFAINNYPVNHKGENILDIDIEYTYYYEGVSNSEYIDYKKIRDRLTQLLTEYPDNTDSWEEINEQIAKIIFDENPALSSLNLTLKILPNQRYPYLRSNSTMLNRCLIPKINTLPGAPLLEEKGDNSTNKRGGENENYFSRR